MLVENLDDSKRLSGLWAYFNQDKTKFDNLVFGLIGASSFGIQDRNSDQLFGLLILRVSAADFHWANYTIAATK